jgi:MerR family Zn(II)-responsive transcriptional regulator of zntA
MYRIGELAKLADVTPDTIRYYEKQQMMDHEVRTEGGFRLYTDNDLQRLRFIRYARQLGLRLNRSANYCRSASIRNIIPVRNQKHRSGRLMKLKHGFRSYKRCAFSAAAE